MTNLRVKQALTVLLGVSVLSGSNLSVRPLTFDLPVQYTLDAMAEGLHNEMMLCLLGEVKPGEVFINRIEVPPIMASTPLMVMSAGCKGRTLAVWHNHPFIPALHEDPADACYLSVPDVRLAEKSRTRYFVVQVNGEVRCWWQRDQILSAERVPFLGNQWRILPIAGQVTR